ncbi:MAG: YpmA family protein [Syntrophomonadaceae bacterium]|nr:YpmA family protein [Syntrophomonadaceae bacterium]MDH7496925.1 YpmA family protein [Syntrophomonadaceae bacterium]
MTREDGDKLRMIAHKTFRANDELVRVVDFLNKTLKDRGLLFGLTKDSRQQEMTINIYEL